MHRLPGYRGFTLIELLLALMITALISVAVCTLTFAALHDDRYLRSANAAQAEVELAIRRVSNNLRQAQDGSINLSSGSLILRSQPDAANNQPDGAVVTYALRPDPDNASRKQLVETDPRYGANLVLANNVGTFTITPVVGVANLYRIDLVLNTAPVSERHVQVFTRN